MHLYINLVDSFTPVINIYSPPPPLFAGAQWWVRRTWASVLMIPFAVLPPLPPPPPPPPLLVLFSLMLFLPSYIRALFSRWSNPTYLCLLLMSTYLLYYLYIHVYVCVCIYMRCPVWKLAKRHRGPKHYIMQHIMFSAVFVRCKQTCDVNKQWSTDTVVSVLFVLLLV